MYTIPTAYDKRTALTAMATHAIPVNKADHEWRIKRELKRLGASPYGMWRFGARYLPSVIHLDEVLGGVVYGFNKEGSVTLVATDKRVIFLDKKPLFVNLEEMTYDIVGGVTFSHAGMSSIITLHTRMRDYRIRTFNDKCARGFMHYVEGRCLEHPRRVDI